MTGPVLDPRFAASLRTALSEQVTSTATTHRKHTRRPGRRWRPAAVSAGAVVLALAGGSIAVAAGLVPLPFRTGAPYDVPLAPGVPTTQVGPLTVPLEDVPAGTNGVRFNVTCLSAGTIRFPDGASLSCEASDAALAAEEAGAKGTASSSVDLTTNSGPLVFDASPGMRWSLKVTWLSRTPTDWQTNARGETFGVAKPDGSSPDLVAAVASNGAVGYYRASEYAALTPAPSTPEEAVRWTALPTRTVSIPMYASDGTTVLGEFELTVQNPQGAKGAQTAPTQAAKGVRR